MPKSILKPLSDVAILMMVTRSKTEEGRKVQAAVLARVEGEIKDRRDALASIDILVRGGNPDILFAIESALAA
jgi:hypothetical protein